VNRLGYFNDGRIVGMFRIFLRASLLLFLQEKKKACSQKNAPPIPLL